MQTPPLGTQNLQTESSDAAVPFPSATSMIPHSHQEIIFKNHHVREDQHWEGSSFCNSPALKNISMIHTSVTSPLNPLPLFLGSKE